MKWSQMACRISNRFCCKNSDALVCATSMSSVFQRCDYFSTFIADNVTISSLAS